MKAAAARCITLTTAMGLAFEYTKLFGARATEVSLVKLWGSLGECYAKVLVWEGWAKNEGRKPAGVQRSPVKLKTALDDVDYVDYVDYGDRKMPASEEEEEEEEEDNDSSDEDYEGEEESDDEEDEEGGGFDVGLVALDDSEQVEGLLRALQEEAAEAEANTGTDPSMGDTAAAASEEEEGEPPRKKRKFSSMEATALKWYKDRKDALDAKEAVETEGKKSVLIDDAADIMKEAQEALESGPQSSPKELLCQLECHERLHTLYETGKLRHTSLSYYIKFMTKDRRCLLHWLGSDELPTNYTPDYTKEDLPKIALRLAKIPPGWELLGDKGFEKIDKFLPFMNAVWTPRVLRDRDMKQYRIVEIEGPDGKKTLCTLRYTSEVGFARVTILDGTPLA